MTLTLDADQHLFESRSLWRDHADPRDRDDALAIIDDDAGNAWVSWRGEHLSLAHVTTPGDPDDVGRQQARARAGLPPVVHYDDALPRDYWDPTARLTTLDRLGFDRAILFPNYGLVWEHALAEDLHATQVNLGAWNRWAADVAAAGDGRLHPVGHLNLREVEWLDDQLGALSAAGVRLAMIPTGLVDGKPLSHRDLDPAWSAFEHHGVSPVFHIASTVRPFPDPWYETSAAGDDPDPNNLLLTSVFIWAAPALALADLALNGALARHPELRIGVMELSAVWVPMFLQFLDGGYAFTSRLAGSEHDELEMPPSEYVKRQVRLAAFSYEQPQYLERAAGDLFMCCSDWPHSEGTDHALDEYAALSHGKVTRDEHPGLFGEHAAWLLRES
jgi:predicted TIM-barrel fold metal-dependent hydrolase